MFKDILDSPAKKSVMPGGVWSKIFPGRYRGKWSESLAIMKCVRKPAGCIPFPQISAGSCIRFRTDSKPINLGYANRLLVRWRLAWLFTEVLADASTRINRIYRTSTSRVFANAHAYMRHPASFHHASPLFPRLKGKTRSGSAAHY